MCHLPHHAHGNRLYSRAGKPTRPIAENRLPAVYINLHADERIDEGYGIRARIFYSEGHLRDTGHVRRQLGDDGMSALRADRTHDLCRRTRIRAKDNPALPDVRTGNVDLERCDARDIQPCGECCIVLHGAA